jgi:serine/threonine protein kinase
VLSEVEHLATLGAGGFGRVTLVSYRGGVYALKQMSKAHIIDNKLVAHVHREKKVPMCCCTSLLYAYEIYWSLVSVLQAAISSITCAQRSYCNCLPAFLQAMLECCSPWLVNLAGTAQDAKNVYMLLEAVMGGELFAYLQVSSASAAGAD